VFVDLEKIVSKTSDYFVDPFHYSEKGNAVVAAAFHEAIVARRLIEKKYPPSP
jgi:hypothetical protein